MRVPMIAGNWKMNTTVKEAVEIVREMRDELDININADKVICPPFISLTSVNELLKGTSIKLGAQNLYFEPKGAYTGEISSLMVADLCEYVIIGHSERRQYFNETGDIVNKKVRAALTAGLKPILCVGERLEENESGRTGEVITEQLRSSLAEIAEPGGLILAYEPIWAIGTGKAATGKQANETIGLIRHSISKLYGNSIALNTRILYGGSVTSDNASEFIRQPEIDGGLIGGASLKADQFISIVKQASDIVGDPQREI
ncbi:triose-phosphate isomerase [Chloroflexota bacterium]